MTDRRRSRRRQLEASHQRNWLTGRHAVTEMLMAGVWPVRRLCVTSDAAEQLHSVLTQHAGMDDRTVSVEEVTADRLTQLCGSRHHQGIAAQMEPFPYRDLSELPDLVASFESAHSMPPLVVICDRIQDGHNLGAILRTCDAMAVTAVLIGEREQTGVTPQVARASAGAVNHVPMICVEEPVDAVELLRELGFQLLAASEKSSAPARQMDTSRATALIIGSEARGVADVLLHRCDQQVVIPMLGQVGSLNAAVAAGMLLYELRRSPSSTST